MTDHPEILYDVKDRTRACAEFVVRYVAFIGDLQARAYRLAAWLGAVPAVLSGGVGILAVVVVCAKVFPALYRVERFPSG